MISQENFDFDIWGHLVLGGFTLLTGYLTFSNLKALIQLTEVLLVPEEQKIIVRRERSKKVVSEHSINDIEIKGQDVQHEEMYRSPMKWFTLYDKKLNKQIFSIRPGQSQTDGGMACGELKEFFNAVMYPQKAEVK